MRIARRRFIKVLAGTTAAASLPLVGSNAAAATPFPTQPVKLVVPTGPGTAMDATCRILSRHLEPQWNQPVVVINSAGAGGVIGADTVARAKPDGHTLLLGHEGLLVIAPLVKDRMASRPRDDLRAVAPVTETEIVLVASKASGIRSIAHLMEEARRRPGKVTYASPGIGTPSHLRMEIFKQQAGIDLLHVPYKGGGASMAGLLGNQVDCTPVAIGVALPHLAADKLTALAISGAKRSPLLPEVPTYSETVPGFEFTVWFGLFAPADTPRDVVEFVSREITNAINAPAIRKALLDQTIIPVGGTPEHLEETVRKDFASYSKLLRTTKIELS
jgi:tripartite-type tricarboxylate transporter receptor subunit TctC